MIIKFHPCSKILRNVNHVYRYRRGKDVSLLVRDVYIKNVEDRTEIKKDEIGVLETTLILSNIILSDIIFSNIILSTLYSLLNLENDFGCLLLQKIHGFS